MKLTLLSRNEMTAITLPEKHLGRYWLRSKTPSGKKINIVSVEALRATEADGEGKWILKSNRNYVIVDHAGKVFQNVELRPSALYLIRSADRTQEFTLYTEPLTSDRKQYRGYVAVKSPAVIFIGRDENNSICYSNSFVSGRHAVISFSANEILIKDCGSTNNTYVNGKAVSDMRLSVGDVVFIMGLQIIVVSGGFFINDPDGKVKMQSPDFAALNIPAYQGEQNNEDFEDIPTEYYYRAPRFKQDVDEYVLKVDPPPEAQNNDEMPMIMLIGPSMTMGMASVASGIFTVTSAIERGNISSAIPSLVMCLSMLLGTLMWPLVTKTYQKRLREKKEAKRKQTYAAYIHQLEELVEQQILLQEQILRAGNLGTDDCVSRVLSVPPRIWERTPKHTDFLRLQLGRGDLPFNGNIQYSERRFSVETDGLLEIMYCFGEKKRELKNVPITLSLTERFISGVYGDKNILPTYAANMILQLVTLHSYDELKLVALYDESAEQDYSFTKMLPHTMNDEQTIRYIATNSDEVKTLSTDLDVIIDYRKGLSDDNLKSEKPYFVVLCFDKELAAKAEFIRRILEHNDNIGFSILCFYNNLSDLPKECMAVVEAGDPNGSLTIINDVSDPPVNFNAAELKAFDIHAVTGVLANTFVDIRTLDFVLPKKYTFFEMLDIGRIEHLNIADNWASNDPTKSLAATIGIDRYGEPFKLDLHERAHGPHGLVAGMTGSGKSEFIISYILSLAVNFRPQEVAFILIDYKGGGMAKSFENIPHTAGVITNLDGNGIKRSLASMRSELHRRERIFRETSEKNNVSNIDIYKYQKLYREGKVSEPLPHLFIISDEFAELKKEQPDFMTELTSTARVGRSLGVHLILATQKPGGVVDDQIRSNSRFKICLKVQDSGDSQEMLGRPEAAALVDTGRFYMQVGYNEIFEMGQSAWAGAPYYPSQRTIQNRDDAVSVLNTNGRVIAEANTNRFANYSDPPKQLDVITGYIAKYCAEENIKRWKMWLDPIAPLIYIDELVNKYRGAVDKRFELSPIIGEVDDPAHQRQELFRLPITAEGNAVVYGSAGSGKAMFLEAICYSLMQEHTPKEVNIYILDFGSETFTAFSESPFVGDVVLSYETEKINNLFKLVAGKLETRKKLISEYGGSFVQYNSQAEVPEASIVVMINNFAAFSEMYEDRVADLSYLTREGTKYGIYFILTCTGVNNIRFNMLQNFKLLYCLQMNNTDDYASVVGKTGGLLPDKARGRGMLRYDKDTVLEFQTASITRDDPPYAFIRDLCKKLSAKYGGVHAQHIPVLPEKVTRRFLAPYVTRGDLSKLPVGVEKSTLDISYYDFAANVVTLILSLNNEWQSFASELSLVAAEECGVETVVLAPMGSRLTKNQSDKLRVGCDTASCVELVHDIYDVVLQRNNEYKQKLAQNGEMLKYPPLLVVIQSMSMLETMLERYIPAEDKREADDDTPLNRLQLSMAKCANEYNVRFVVCESIAALTPLTIENWYKTHINGSSGIWIGNGIDSQFRLMVNKKPQEYSANIDADFGFVIKHGAASLVKFMQ